MNPTGWMELGVFLGALLLLAPPLGAYIERVLEGRTIGLDVIGRPLEQVLYRLCGAAAQGEMTWRAYVAAVVMFELLGAGAVVALQMLQDRLPLNPDALAAVPLDRALNTAISFVTNTDWQSYSGENTLSPLTQMLALTVQNFTSAAVGVAVFAALVRGFVRKNAATIGNFWVDLTRATLYLLLPLAVIFALVLVSLGVVQTLATTTSVALLEPQAAPAATAERATDAITIVTQPLPLGPAASQIAIKQLGTNGGGFFGANAAHPFENPTPLSNFLQCLAIVLIPTALTFAFGRMVGDRRQGWVLLAAMLITFVPLCALCISSEQGGNPRLIATAQGAATAVDATRGNLEGKELRLGAASSAIWASATAAAANGSVNAMHDSFTPLGGFVPMLLIQLGGVIFGGIGYGMAGMLMYAIVAVFVAGLMIGRTPEYLGKKIETSEMQMAALLLVVPCLPVLIGTALAVTLPAGAASLTSDGAHGLSQALYAFSSAGYNNGSAFAGLAADTPFYNYSTAAAMWIGHWAIIIPALAIAGGLAAKKHVPVSPGTLPTHTPQFALLVVAVLFVVGALNFVPALALGPVAEHFQMHAAAAPSVNAAPILEGSGS